MVSTKDGDKAYAQHSLFYRLNNLVFNTFFSAQLLARSAIFIKRASILYSEGNFNAGLLM
jgi:hypothetical protein